MPVVSDLIRGQPKTGVVPAVADGWTALSA